MTRAPALALLALLSTMSPASAQGSSTTERLIELLVQKGVLPADQARDLLRQAEQEQQAPAAKPARRAAPRAQPAQSTPVSPGIKPPALAEKPVAPGTVRVTYVPEIVRRQIADEVRGEVMQQAQAEHWAQPNVLPDWVQRVRVFGDFRLRGESDLFRKPDSTNQTNGRGNYPFFPDINGINNSASGFDTSGASLPPLLNSYRDRERVRVRARIGVDAQIDDGLTTEIRIATGNDNSPVTTNQTLGQNGAFSKYALWLDRAFIKYQPRDWISFYGGRSSNPFWTSDLLFYNDLGFDGFAASINPRITPQVTGFLVAGAFPVFNTAFNLGTADGTKLNSRDGWLYGVQGGADWQISKDYAAKIALGYFAFSNVSGKLSSPCSIYNGVYSCDTDNTRPLFLQFGNTYFPIRQLVQNPNNLTGPTPQYFGLASNFDILDLHARFDIDRFAPYRISLEADYATNLGYNRRQIEAKFPANPTKLNSDTYKSGSDAYLARLTVGTPDISKRWDWNVSLAYKYLETDAVLDALTDPDFHLGGTNAKGFILGGNLGLARNTFIAVRWLSANEVSGPPYANDVLQADLNVKF